MLKKWVLLIKPTSGSMLENSSKWYHISTYDINHTRRWFHKWSSTLSDHQVKKVPSHTRPQVYQMDDPWNDLGGGVPPIGIKVKRSYIRYLKGYKWCHSIILSSIHKKCKIQVSTIYTNAILCINEKHTFYENWWERGISWNKDT